ncbi:tetratricopeptide repeat protein [Aeromonas caviae]|uniref:tetratricopeptide repeat protein n=1 Tax=Aeromonas caviae TaxID=648 RepID=UPI003755030A
MNIDLEQLELDADLGCISAQFALGEIYENGPERNYEKANDLYRNAALNGYADAQFRLGQMHELWHSGMGFYFGKMVMQADDIKREYEQAVAWYHKAADQGLTLIHK